MTETTNGQQSHEDFLKSQILAADDVDFEDVPVPEWGGIKVRVRGMSGTERDGVEAHSIALRRSGKDIELRLQNYRSRILVKCLRSPETDQRIFTDAEADALGTKSGLVVDRLFDVATRLSGMDEAALGRAEGNSGSDPSDSSTTD